jgi:hypothetical protein
MRPLWGQCSGAAANVGVVQCLPSGRPKGGMRPLWGQCSGEAANVGVVQLFSIARLNAVAT